MYSENIFLQSCFRLNLHTFTGWIALSSGYHIYLIKSSSSPFKVDLTPLEARINSYVIYYSPHFHSTLKEEKRIQLFGDIKITGAKYSASQQTLSAAVSGL